jgi:putative ABC transport system permease protein
MLWREIRASIVGLARRPGFGVAVVTVFGIAISVSTTVFALAHAWLIRGFPFPNPAELIAIDTTVGATRGNLSGREVRDLPRDSRLIADLAGYYPSQYNVTGGSVPEALTCIITSQNLFRILGVSMVHGDAWSASSDWTEQYLIALDHDVWLRRYGGDPAIAGRAITLDGAPYIVTGVLPRGFHFPRRVDMFRAVTGFYAETLRRYSAVARLRPGVSIAAAQAELDDLALQYERSHPDTNRDVRFHVRPLRDSYVGDMRPYVVVLAAAVALVVIISTANVVNLCLVAAIARRHEVSIRTALGAGRWRVVVGFMTESLALALVGGAVGTVLASGLLPVLQGLMALDLPPWMDVRLDLPVVIFALTLSVAVGSITGIATSFGAIDRESVPALRSGTRGAIGNVRQRRIRAALVTGQIALAVAVLLGAGLTTKSLARLGAVDLGLQADDVMTFRVDPPWKKYPEQSNIAWFYERTLERLQRLPGVTGVGANHKLPLAGLSDITQTVSIDGEVGDQSSKPFVNVQYVSPGYFSAMGIAIDAGRPFSHADRESSQRVAIVSGSAARRFWPGRDALGQRLLITVRIRGFGANNSADTWFTVVGVAHDVRSVDPTRTPDLDAYVPIFQAYAGDAFFVVRSHTPAGVRMALASAVRDVDPDQSIFDVVGMDERIATRIWQQRATASVMTIFAITTLALVSVGVFALVSFAVAEQTREIGVRVALGARTHDVRRLVFSQAMVPVTIGVTVGLPVALLAARGLHAILFGVGTVDPTVTVGVPVVVVVAALLACALPARRAANVDPIVVLRNS